MIWMILVIVAVILLYSIRQVDQFERGVKFQFGKFVGIVDPGWRIVIPVIQSMRKVDMRTKVIDVPTQDAITKDNISIRINAVLFFNVFDAGKSVVAVEDYRFAISQLAQTTMRNAVGEVTLDGLLAERESISSKIQSVVEEASDCWGVKVQNVELRDVLLPEEMKRVLAREAEAEREKRAVITKAQGEVEAAENLAQAAKTMYESPGALHLRTLTTITAVSSDASNTMLFAFPVEMIDAFANRKMDVNTLANNPQVAEFIKTLTNKK